MRFPHKVICQCGRTVGVTRAKSFVHHRPPAPSVGGLCELSGKTVPLQELERAMRSELLTAELKVIQMKQELGMLNEKKAATRHGKSAL